MNNKEIIAYIQNFGFWAHCAFCSRSSMNRFDMTADSGSPMAKPSTCLYSIPLNWKYVALVTKDSSSMMSSTVSFVRFFRVLSASRRFLTMVRVALTGVLVNRDTTSWDISTSSCSTVTLARSLASWPEFLQCWGVLPRRFRKMVTTRSSTPDTHRCGGGDRGGHAILVQGGMTGQQSTSQLVSQIGQQSTAQLANQSLMRSPERRIESLSQVNIPPE